MTYETTTQSVNVNFDVPLTFFLIRNQEGKFFRAKGFSGHGQSWVEDVRDAKVYQKLGQARSRVTFFANNYPEYGIPEILTITAVNAVVLQETKRVAKAIQKKQDKELAREQQRIKWEQDRLDSQQKKLDAQKDKLKMDRKKMEAKNG